MTSRARPYPPARPSRVLAVMAGAAAGVMLASAAIAHGDQWLDGGHRFERPAPFSGVAQPALGYGAMVTLAP